MKTQNKNLVPFSAVGIMNAEPQPCEFCQGPIPLTRNAGSKFCSDSHKQLAYVARKKMRAGNDNIEEEAMAPPKHDEEITHYITEGQSVEAMTSSEKIEDQTSTALKETELPPAVMAVSEQPVIEPVRMQSQASEESAPARESVSERPQLQVWLRVTEQIIICIKDHLKRKECEIPVNQIHSLLPPSFSTGEADIIKMPDFTLKYSSTKTKYLIHKNLESHA